MIATSYQVRKSLTIHDDDLETIAVSKRSISLLPQKEVVRTDLQPFKQETQPLAKIWCVKMEEETHQANELNSPGEGHEDILEGEIQTLGPSKGAEK